MLTISEFLPKENRSNDKTRTDFLMQALEFLKHHKDEKQSLTPYSKNKLSKPQNNINQNRKRCT